MAVLIVTDASFEAEVLASELPVLVALLSSRSAPSKLLEPVLRDVEGELSGKIKVVAVDIDSSPIVAQMFRVQSVPMLAIVQEGRVVAHHAGGIEKSALLELLAPVLPASASEIDPKTLAQLIAMGRVVPIDIRDAFAFGRFRIPGAQHIAAADLATRANDLVPSDGRLRVLYDRTTDDAKAHAETLRESGIDVGFLHGGFLHWESDGFEVERGQ